MKFKEDVMDYARNSTASIEDINKAIYTAISAGSEYTDVLELLSKTEKLSDAGRADLVETTKLVVSVLNAYGLSAKDAEAVSDALFTTVKDGQTTLPELAASLAQVTTVAANSGVSFDELMASLAALTVTGMPTDGSRYGHQGGDRGHPETYLRSCKRGR